MQINWIKCSEQMPPDDESYLIVTGTYSFKHLAIISGHQTRHVYAHGDFNWTPYTEEAWKELTNAKAS